MFDPVFWIKTAQLVLALAILIICHEGGHFIAAKCFGIKVEKFFLFFDYKWHLISTRDAWVQRLFPAVRNWETEYGIGWIPLGGYVKIAGMIDESMDKEQMRQPVQPWEFRAKLPWQRLIVMLGGVAVNMLLAMLIYAGIMWAWGSDSLPMDRNFADGFHFNRTAQEMGFMNGDKPLRLDSTEIKEYHYGQFMTALAEARTVTVLRQGEGFAADSTGFTPYEVEIELPEDFPLLTVLKEQPRFLAPISPAIIDSVAPGTPAAEAGWTSGTRLMALDDIDGVMTDICSWNAFNEIMQRRYDVINAEGCTAADSLRMRGINVQFMLPGDTMCRSAHMTLTPELTFGMVMRMWAADAVFDHHDYTIFEAIPEGCQLGWDTLVDYVAQLKYLFSKEGAQSVGSFGTIGSLFPATWDWNNFWSLTAFISIILAFMNVLPIPGLDGGHAFFTIIEMLTGYTFSEKFQERAITVGFALIMMLMLLAIYNDLDRFVF